jgi:ADP-ribose pyrophosphatase YjhB (NUDIX family)
MKSIPQPGERHLTTAIFVLTNSEPRKVLLLHHKKFDMWMPPGGHVEWNENPYQGAIRETKEESGIDITSHLPAPFSVDDHATFFPVPRYVLEERIAAHGDQPEHFHTDHVYVVDVPHADVAHDPNESHGIGWFTHEETLSLSTFENVRAILRELFGAA